MNQFYLEIKFEFLRIFFIKFTVQKDSIHFDRDKYKNYAIFKRLTSSRG